MDAVILFEDTLQKQHDGDKHRLKHEWWAARGIEIVRTRFDGKHGVPWSFGDYCADGSNVVVDTKSGLGELSGNLGRDHSRFTNEIRRANADGCMLVVLIETDEAESIEDVREYVNDHCRHCNYFYNAECDPRDGSAFCLKHGTKPPLQGETMAKQMKTMEANRWVRFEFVPPDLSAKRICELLGVSYER